MPTVLVTGASRGIGQATAIHLAELGWDVIGGTRTPDAARALEALSPEGRIRAIELDVCDPEHIAALAGALPDSLDAVVNNAGVVVGGPVETVTAAELRRQFEINVFGQIEVSRAVLPRLRASRGRIVFVSSLSGRISTPMTGAYNASKAALESLADAMRLELKSWGVDVVLIEPAQTDTDLWQKAEAVFDENAAALPDHYRGLYADHLAGFRKTIPASQRLATSPQGVTRAIERALTTSRPRARYVVGAGPRVQAAFMHLAPTPVTDRILSSITRMPRRSPTPR